jgi:hypothetical protein
MPGYLPPYDWHKDDYFNSYHRYDPVVDGFAYPSDPTSAITPEPRESCYCTQDPASPHNATICEPCFERLLSETGGTQ